MSRSFRTLPHRLCWPLLTAATLLFAFGLGGCPASRDAVVTVEPAIESLPLSGSVPVLLEPGGHAGDAKPNHPARFVSLSPGVEYTARVSGEFLAVPTPLTIGDQGHGAARLGVIPLQPDVLQARKKGAKWFVVDLTSQDALRVSWTDQDGVKPWRPCKPDGSTLTTVAQEEWKKHGRRRGNDERRDRAVLVAGANTTPQRVLAAAEAVLKPTRMVGTTEKVSAFEIVVTRDDPPSLSTAAAKAIVVEAVRAVPEPPPLPPPSAEDVRLAQARAEAANALGFELYRTLASQPGNLVLCPPSIVELLAMCQAGAAGQTAAQLGKVLRSPRSTEDLLRQTKALNHVLQVREYQGKHDARRTQIQLTIANGMWGQTGYAFRAPFIATLQESFAVRPLSLDFAQDPAGSAKTVNAWVSEHTKGRIPAILDPDKLPANTRIILANAAYFKATWRYPFVKDSTKPAPFRSRTAGETTVQMMHQTTRLPYAKGADMQAVELAYSVPDFAMILILPDEGAFERVEAELDEALAYAAEHFEFQRIDLALPRTKAHWKDSIIPSFEELGVTDAFKPQAADFSAMSDAKDIFVGLLTHAVDLKVDEEGTEAAAATVMGGFGTGGPVESIPLTFERPFFLAIHDTKTGAILFLGRIDKP